MIFKGLQVAKSCVKPESAPLEDYELKDYKTLESNNERPS